MGRERFESRREEDARWAAAWGRPLAFSWRLALPLAMTGAAALIAAGDDPLYLAWRWGGLVPPLMASLDGQWWRVIAAPWLHADLAHLLTNVLALGLLGRLASRLFGLQRAVLIVLLSAWGSCVVTLMWAPAWLVGASGGIFGLLGAVGAAAARTIRRAPKVPRGLWSTLLAWTLIALAVALGQLSAAGHLAHAAGLVFGASMGAALGLRALGAPPRPRGWMAWRTVLVAAHGWAGAALVWPSASAADRSVDTGGGRLSVPAHWVAGPPIAPCPMSYTDGLRYACALPAEVNPDDATLETVLEAAGIEFDESRAPPSLPPGWAGRMARTPPVDGAPGHVVWVLNSADPTPRRVVLLAFVSPRGLDGFVAEWLPRVLATPKS